MLPFVSFRVDVWLASLYNGEHTQHNLEFDGIEDDTSVLPFGLLALPVFPEFRIVRDSIQHADGQVCLGLPEPLL